MKKRSILLTCIVAVMALAMFVGCDNAPVLPSFVVGGTINQTGDFLEGQTFDPSKFTVTITYDNGRIVAADETVSVYLDKDTGETGKVNAGDTVKADLGKNFADSDICATAAVKVYSIKSISVTGPESYVYEDDNRDIVAESDLTVTATYIDSDNLEQTMILVPGEYEVTEIPENVVVTLSAPACETSVEVTANVGNFNDQDKVSTDFAFTLTYGEPVTEFVDVASITLKKNASLAALDYETLPAPSFDDVTIMVNTANSKVPAQLIDEPEDMRLFYVDSSTGLEVNETSFVDGTTLIAGVEYDGVKVLQQKSEGSYTYKISVKTATVELKKTNDYDFSGFVRGEALPEIDSDNIIATLKLGDSEYQEIEDTSAIVYKYYNADNSSEITDGLVPATGGIYIGAEYLGATTGSVRVTVPNDSILAKASTKYVWPGLFFDTAEAYTAPAKQYYDDIDDVISALSVNDLVFKTIEAGDEEITVDPADVDVYYSTTDVNTTGGKLSGSTALTDARYTTEYGNNSLVNNNVYIIAEYPVFDAETNVTTIYVSSKSVNLSEPVVENTELVVSYADTEEGETPLIGKGVAFTVKTSNADGLVGMVSDNATNKERYSLILDGSVSENWAAIKVTDKAQTVVLYDNETGKSLEAVTIVAGLDYIANPEAIKAELVSDKVLISGTVIADNDYLEPFTADDFKATVTVGEEEKNLEIVGIEIPASLKATGTSYGVPVRVQYTNSTGETTTKVVKAAVPVVEDYPIEFTATQSRDIFSGLTVSYNYFNFAVTKWASNPTVTVEPVPVPIADKSQFNVNADSKIAGEAGVAQTINMTWTPEEEAIADKTVAVTGIITPIADYPVSITTSSSTISGTVNTTYDDDDFDFKVDWKSQQKYTDGNAPVIDYKYSCATTNPATVNADSVTVGGSGSYVVEITWSCNGHTSETPISVTINAQN